MIFVLNLYEHSRQCSTEKIRIITGRGNSHVRVWVMFKLIKSGKIKLNIRFTNNKNLKFRKKEHTCFFVICDAPVSHCKKSVEECIVFSMACVSCKLPASLELKTIKDSFSNKSYVVRLYGPLLLRFCELFSSISSVIYTKILDYTWKMKFYEERFQIYLRGIQRETDGYHMGLLSSVCN